MHIKPGHRIHVFLIAAIVVKIGLISIGALRPDADQQHMFRFCVLVLMPLLVVYISALLIMLYRSHEKLEDAYAAAAIKQREQQRQRVLLDTLLNHMPMAIFAKDAANGFPMVMINRKAEELFSRPAEKMIGLTDYELSPKEEADFFRATDERVMAGGALVEIEEEPVTTTKGTFIAHTYKVPIYDEQGKPQLLLGILEDVTGTIEAQHQLRRAKEEAERASQTKSEFLATMSHELRTPMNSVLGMTQLLLDDTKTTPEHREMLEVIAKSGANLINIVNDILDISKIEAGGMQLETISFDLEDRLRDTVESLRPIASAKGLLLEWHRSHIRLGCVMGDPLRLTRILTNLIGNAIKYTDHGTVALEVDAAPLPGSRLRVAFSVSDTGMGIAAEDQKHIFNTFTQADSSITRRFGGTGLGLAITKHLVALMGGEIGVASQEGEGARFFFTLELPQTAATTPCGMRISDMPPEPKWGKRIPASTARVLVAEDHALNQIYIRKLLERIGITRFELAHDGQAAEIALQTAAYDLVLMDCHMPHKSGYDVTRDTRAREKENGGHIPIVAMTANAMLGDREKCLAAGMDDYVSKPITRDALIAALQKWIDFEERPAVEDIDPVQPDPADLSILFDLAGDDAALKRHFIAVFVQETVAGISTLSRCAAHCDTALWCETAHKLKSGAANIGAEKLRQLCLRAGEMSQSNAAERNCFLMDIERAFAEVKSYLRRQNIM